MLQILEPLLVSDVERYDLTPDEEPVRSITIWARSMILIGVDDPTL